MSSPSNILYIGWGCICAMFSAILRWPRYVEAATDRPLAPAAGSHQTPRKGIYAQFVLFRWGLGCWLTAVTTRKLFAAAHLFRSPFLYLC